VRGEFGLNRFEYLEVYYRRMLPRVEFSMMDDVARLCQSKCLQPESAGFRVVG
jgi:hypothetical protein